MSSFARRLRRWFAPPTVEGDAEATRVGRVLHTLLLVGLAIDVVVGPLTAALGIWTPLTLALNGPRIVAFLALLALTRRGRPLLASVLFTLVLWVFISAGLWARGGLRSPMLTMFFPLVLVAAMLLGPRAAVGAVVLSVGSGLVLLLGERAHYLPTSSPPSLEQVWLSFLVSLVVVVAVALLANAELRRANRSLRAEIDERQRAEEERRGLQDQLLQSQKMESVGRLAGGLAHDFNNQLMIITAHGQLLERSLDPGDPRRERLGHVMGAADHSSRLVRQLLVFSRDHAPEPRVVDLNRLVGEAIPILRPLLGRDVTLATRLNPSLAHVRADPNRLQQVLMNLAVNARDAMPGGGDLAMETSNRELGPPDSGPAGRYAVLSVRDTGVGMEPDVCSRVFEPFFTTKTEGEGTGLGLTVAYGIVQQCGGHMSLESEPGRGTTFRVHLPALPDTDRAEPVPPGDGVSVPRQS